MCGVQLIWLRRYWRKYENTIYFIEWFSIPVLPRFMATHRRTNFKPSPSSRLPSSANPVPGKIVDPFLIPIAPTRYLRDRSHHHKHW